MQLPGMRRLPSTFDFEAANSRSTIKWLDIVRSVPYDASDADLREPYRRAVAAVVDEVDMHYAERLAALPFEDLVQHLKHFHGNFATFQQYVRTRGYGTPGTRITGRILSGGHTPFGDDEPSWKVELTDGTTAFMLYHDFLWSNEDDEDEQLKRAQYERGQACLGLEIPLVILHRDSGQNLVMVGRKQICAFPFVALSDEPQLSFDGIVLRKDRKVATVLMNVDWGQLGCDPFAYMVGPLPRSELHWKAWLRLKPGVHVPLRIGKCDIEHQDLQFVPEREADRPDDRRQPGARLDVEDPVRHS